MTSAFAARPPVDPPARLGPRARRLVRHRSCWRRFERVAHAEPVEAASAPVRKPTQVRRPQAKQRKQLRAPPSSEALDLPEPSVPPAGDLDARFFEESSAEAWLAHELELRDPRFVRKMTAGVARRRAHLARYVLGVVGVAVALCLAALVKSAVPAGDDESRPHPASLEWRCLPTPPFAPLSAADPVETGRAGADASDGGRLTSRSCEAVPERFRGIVAARKRIR